MPQDDWAVLAHILRPQGRKGEVLAELLTDFPESLIERENLFLAPEGFKGRADEARPVTVASFFLPTGRQQGRVVLHLAGYESISAAETLANLDIVTPANARLTLADSAAEAYISDLIGCTLYDQGVAVGRVEDVTFPTSPDGGRRLEDAAPLLMVLTPAGEEVLIPFVKAFLPRHDAAIRRLDMVLPAGLLEVNSREADAETGPGA